MPEPLVYLLLIVALVLPVPGVMLLRLLWPRIGQRSVAIGAAALFVCAILSAVILARSEVRVLRIGSYSLLLPGTQPLDVAVLLPSEAPVAPPPVAPTRPGATSAPAATAQATATLEATATPAPTATPEPTVTPEPTATLEPTATGTPTPAPAAGRRYVVQAGDTFRAIAERFGVSVPDLLRANNLTPEQADNLRVGQELVIP
ncbi:MAG: LysM peptidoglycan-binding domain-containing protein [Chloroflexaceae bacterium]|nr:LysM peptidoglycan-binding domain-containing protein [Chloroflexaceae bacterium]